MSTQNQDSPSPQEQLRLGWNTVEDAPRLPEIHWYDTLPSTSQWLSGKVRDNPAIPTTLCSVRHQSAGIGRRGRQWHSPVDSITFSLSYPFMLLPAALSGLSLVAGLSIVTTLNRFCPADYRLKWPNDVWLDERKLAGILIEIPWSDTAAARLQCITGVGINITAGQALSDVDQPYALLSSVAELPDLQFLTGALAAQLCCDYARFSRLGWSDFAGQWQALDALYGREVDIQGGNTHRQGRAVGVANNGGLRVEVAEGEIVVHAGEVSVRTR